MKYLNIAVESFKTDWDSLPNHKTSLVVEVEDSVATAADLITVVKEHAGIDDRENSATKLFIDKQETSGTITLSEDSRITVKWYAVKKPESPVLATSHAATISPKKAKSIRAKK